jgi:hypothetical protein
MNTLIYGMHWKSQIKAIKELEKSNDINVVFWIGAHKEADLHIGKLRRFKIKKEFYSGINSDIYEKVFYETIDTFIDMFSRVPSAYTMTYQEYINIFNYYYDYFSKILLEKKVELMIFYMLPHFGSDYILTSLAKHLNIKMILIYQSLVPNRFFYVHSLEDYGKFENIYSTFEHENLTIPKKAKKELFYMKNIKLKYRSCTIVFLRQLVRWVFRKIGAMSFMGLSKQYYDCLSFKYYYSKYAKKSVDFTLNYVYFPLQMQPELTTTTLGGVYKDQLLAIEKLSKLIPNDWKIYIKENPKQLGSYRDKYFFERLNLIENAVYISKEVNTYDLLENAKFSATVTGTVGWEAISAGQPTLIFGKAWFETLPGVIKYKEDLKIDDILKIKIDHSRLEEEYNKLISKTADGIIDRGYITAYKDYSDETNSINVEKSLRKIINNLYNNNKIK